jgi:2Fe-2S ferredoxin
MPRITYIEPDGRQVVVELTEGLSVMQAAMDSGIEGLEAQCGGSCACATCHCYVEEGGEGLADPDGNEAAMLASVAAERLPNSRLSCQLKPEVDLTVRFPKRQT